MVPRCVAILTSLAAECGVQETARLANSCSKTSYIAIDLVTQLNLRAGVSLDYVLASDVATVFSGV